jgi:NAD(P)H-dependent FMN reductase
VNLLILSCSLNSESNSRMMAEEASRVATADGHAVTLVDLRTLSLPVCDGETAYGAPGVGALGRQIASADAILIASPIYNYDFNAAAKNAIELTGKSWENKVVGFLCAAGGTSSYMAVMPFANSLMLDFRCLIVPRFVYATGAAFPDGKLNDPKVVDRIAELVRAAAKLGAALKNA